MANITTVNTYCKEFVQQALSRIENHAEDIKLSTLERFAAALGKKLTVNISPKYADRVADARADYKPGRLKRRKA